MKISRRRFLAGSLAAGSLLAFPAPAFLRAGTGSKIRIGSISCGGRANDLLNTFLGNDDVEVIALCDPDESRREKTAERLGVSQKFVDPRDLLEVSDIDAVIVATCNHWHCLGAIWAMEAGKDVYVEKPLAHNQWEGAQTVAAARKYDRICQVGMQQRSDPMQAEIKKFLHEEKQIGKLLRCRVNHYSVRLPIGKNAKPLEFPKNVDKNIWLGPAEDRPIYRDKLQYDWHWDWNTGNGEMGNWGVHVLDDTRNNVLLDNLPMPKKVLAGAARYGYDDAGESPNVHFVYFDGGTMPVVLGLSHLQMKDDPKSAGNHPGPGSGYIVYGEGGRLEGQRGAAVAFDADGKEIRRFSGDSGQAEHIRNFLDAVIAHDRTKLNAEVAVGNDSCGWCNAANIAYRSGKPYRSEDMKAVPDTAGLWEEVVAGEAELLKSYGTDFAKAGFSLSPLLTIDTETGKFVGEGAEEANKYLKRTYRPGFEVPEIK